MRSTTVSADSMRLERPAPLARTLVLAAVALAAGMTLTRWITLGGRTSFAGRLQAHAVTVTAGHAGQIQSMLVKVGENVSPGDVLATLSDSQLQAELHEQQRRVAALEGELQQAQARAEVDLAWRTKQLDADILETRLRSSTLLREKFSHELDGIASLDATEADPAAPSAGGAPFHPVTYELSQPEPERLRAILFEEQHRNAAEVCAAQVKLCETRLEELQTLKRALPAKVFRANGVELAQTKLEQAQAVLKQLRTRQDNLQLTAPTYGTVGVFQKRSGDHVEAREAIVELLDNDRPFVVALVPSAQVLQFPVGTEVALQFPAGEECRGRVVHVPPQTADPSLLGTDASSDGLVPVQIERVGRLWPELPIGSAVNVSPLDR